jgi:hydrogenase maturation protease
MSATHQPETPARPQPESARVLVVGCGRQCRRDDQAGLVLAHRLAERHLPGVRVVTTESPGTDLLTELAGVELLIIIDAAQAPAEARSATWRRLPIVEGGVDRIDTVMPTIDPRRSASSHHLGVREALSMGRDLAVLPPTVWIYAVPSTEFGYGERLSDSARKAVDELTRRVPSDIAAWLAAAKVRHA